MVPIRQQLCPVSRYVLKCPFERTPTRIVVHNTANDAPAVNEVSYMISRSEEVSFHYAVDDREIVQGLPEERNAWASGDGRGPGNMEGIHIEICYSLGGGERFQKAEQNAAELIAGLLKKYGWGLEKVTAHRDYDGKYCPHRTLELGWDRFLVMVKGYMEKEKSLTYEQFKTYMLRYEKELAEKEAEEWAKPAVKFCQEKKIMVGDTAKNFRPLTQITRQEVAQVAKNLFDVIAGSAE